MEGKKTKIKKDLHRVTRTLKGNSKNRGITLIALVITIVLNCSSLAMERMYKKEKILKIN